MKNSLVIQLVIFAGLASVAAALAYRAGAFHNLVIGPVRTSPAPAKSPKVVPKPMPKLETFEEPAIRPEPRIMAANPFLRLSGSSSADSWLSAEAATDRVAAEMMDAVLQKPTLIIWLFDTTDSARRLRDPVIQRLDHVYRTLATMKSQGHEAFQDTSTPPLLSAVGTFHSEVEFLTPEPTEDSDAFLAAVNRIRGDSSGEETTFAAIQRAVSDFAKSRSRRTTLIAVVSDERGDDAGSVDELIPLLERQAISLLVIGSPAPLGREGTLSSTKEMENGKPIHCGPESFASEMIDAENWKVTFESVPLFDSGFGPFALSRLAQKSGGAYLAVRSTGSTGRFGSFEQVQRFDAEAMKPYKPDYVSTAAYQQILDSNKACMALHNAAKLPPVELATGLTLEFVKKDEATLTRLLSKAQQTAARIEPQLRNVYTVLQQGESDRPKLTSPRWQAEFDLTMGHLLAGRARIEGYNALLAQLKQGKTFPEAGQDTWILTATDDVSGDSSLEKLIKQAKSYLERVVHDHPGTPWAYMASRELAAPLGWKWEAR